MLHVAKCSNWIGPMQRLLWVGVEPSVRNDEANASAKLFMDFRRSHVWEIEVRAVARDGKHGKGSRKGEHVHNALVHVCHYLRSQYTYVLLR